MKNAVLSVLLCATYSVPAPKCAGELPAENDRIQVPVQSWPQRPGPRTVRALIHYPGSRLENVNQQTGIMLTLHN
jgi:hypothetical protein